MRVNIGNSSQNKSGKFTIEISNSSGSLNDQIYAKDNKDLSIEVNAVKNGGDLNVNIKNNEAFTIGFNYIFSVFKSAI